MRALRGTLVSSLLAAACGGGGTTPAPRLLAVEILPGDDAALQVGQSRTLAAQVVEAGVGAVDPRPITWLSTDPSKASLSAATGATVTVTAVAAGSTTIRATSAGATPDQLTLVVSGTGPPPASAAVAMSGSRFVPAFVDVAVGGRVTWTNQDGILHNVTFDQATGAPAAIPSFPTGSEDATFAAAGTFGYRCTLHSGMNGTVVAR